MFTFAKKTYPRASLTNKALMIVDMQDDFLNNHKTNKYTSQFFKLKQKVIKSVKEKIEEANDSNSEIILVEYD
jgi:nicotinamidase-related amidase